MKIVLFCLVLLCGAIPTFAQKQLAVTIDDFPFLYGRWLTEDQEHQRFRAVLATLKKHDVKIMAFVVGSRVSEGWEPLLDELIADGHTIANHTATHPDLNETATHWYIQDIARCDSVLQPWQDSIKYFRYPFLHRGATAEKYDRVKAYLVENAYTIVPVTIDNDDWRFNKEYTDALRARDTASAHTIGAEYLEHIKQKTAYFDSIATKNYKRPIKHILLLHMTELNAVYLDAVLTWYESEGWSLITTQEALTDPLYAQSEPYRGANGISWLLRFRP